MRGSGVARRWKWCVVAVVLAATMFVPSGVALADIPAGPAGTAQTQTWHVTKPACAITQAWRKHPAISPVTSIDFVGKMSCASVPANLYVGGRIDVYDSTTGGISSLSAPAVLSASGSMDSSTGSQTFALRATLSSPRPGTVYDFQFSVSFVEKFNPYNVDGVSGVPPQCSQQSNPPFEDGPQPYPPSVDCEFIEVAAIP